MAPTAPNRTPSATSLRLARISGAIHPLAPQKVHRKEAKVTDSFIQSKRDRRTIKHSSFISKIHKSAPRTSTGTKVRRPNKKLVTTLESLADALPDVSDEGVVDGTKIRHKSLKSKPGVLKRREKLVRGEMERFGVAMARLHGTAENEAKSHDGGKMVDGGEDPSAAAAASSSRTRWAALRGYVAATMDQNPAFSKR